MWTYQNELFDPAKFSYESLAGFVYLIVDKTNDKKYVGKKNFWSTRKLPPLKGKSRKRIKKVESDWRDYYGSSEKVKSILEEYGPDRFDRYILHLCKSKGEMSYMEMKEQIDREVLFKEEYYNEFIGGKIHAKHVNQK